MQQGPRSHGMPWPQSPFGMMMGDARVPGAGYRAHGSSRERHPFDGPRETTRPPRPMATEEHAIRVPGSKHARGIPERPSSFGAFGTLPGRRRRTYFFARFHRAHLIDEDAPQCARIDAPAVQGGVKDSAFSLAFDAFGENPFDFFVTEDSFKATRGTDSLELSKLDAAVLQVNLKDGNEAKELFITRDGLRLTCTLQINATTIPCAVSEFGQTAMLASLGLEEFEVTGTLMRGRSLRGCEVSAFDPEMAGNIVVVSPGGCSFEDKARNAEASGAAAVVVVNDARSIFVMADAGRPRASGLAAVMASFADAAELDVNVGRRATLKVSKTNVSGPVSLSDGAALVPAGSTPLAKKRLNTRRQAAVGARTITVVAQKGWALVATLDSSEDAFWRVYLTPQEAAPLSEARPNAAAGMPRRANASSWNTNARPKDACAKSDCGIGECAAPSPLAGQRPARAEAGVAHKK